MSRRIKLAIPDLISNSYFPAVAAVELGFFREEGIDASVELIFPVDKAYAAMREGAVDFVGGIGTFRAVGLSGMAGREASLCAGTGDVLVSGDALAL